MAKDGLGPRKPHPTIEGRDDQGRLMPGTVLNPKGGRPQTDYRLRNKYLDSPVLPEAFEDLDIPAPVLAALPKNFTYRELIAARTIHEAARGGASLQSALDRLWPKTERREHSFDDSSTKPVEMDNSPEALRETIEGLKAMGVLVVPPAPDDGDEPPVH